jgi:uncharacterized membrane protein YhaH (DUF805 family)
MTPIDYAQQPLRKYATFSGRARRAEYWWYILGLVVAYIVAMIIDNLLGLSGMVGGVYGPAAMIVALGTLVPSLAVAVRRLHDTNRSGWWMLLVIVPYVIMGVSFGMAAGSDDPMGALASAGLVSILALIGGIVLLIFLVLEGTKGDNRFGPDPKADERSGAVAAE